MKGKFESSVEETREVQVQKLLTDSLMICLMSNECATKLEQAYGEYHGIIEIPQIQKKILDTVNAHPLSLMDFGADELVLDDQNIRFFLRAVFGNNPKYLLNNGSLNNLGVMIFDKAYCFAQEFYHDTQHSTQQFRRTGAVYNVSEIENLYIGNREEQSIILGLTRAFLHIIMKKELGDTVLMHSNGYSNLFSDKPVRQDYIADLKKSQLVSNATITIDSKRGNQSRSAGDVVFDGVKFDYAGRIKTIKSTVMKLMDAKYETINKHTDTIGERYTIKTSKDDYNGYVTGGLKLLWQLYQENDFTEIPEPRVDIKGDRLKQSIGSILGQNTLSGLLGRRVEGNLLYNRFVGAIQKCVGDAGTHNLKTGSGFEEMKIVTNSEKQIRRQHTNNEKGLGNHYMYDIRKQIANQMRGVSCMQDVTVLRNHIRTIVEKLQSDNAGKSLLKEIVSSVFLKKNPTSEQYVDELLRQNAEVLGMTYDQAKGLLHNTKASDLKKDLKKKLYAILNESA